MNKIDEKILSFIKKHHVLTLATSTDNKPYCSTMFYVYSEKDNMFIFTSNEETKHVQDIIKNPLVAGAIALETSIIGKIQGIQFTGIIKKLDGEFYKEAKQIYTHKFPIANLTHLNLWGVEVDFFKLTDNRLGFGKKLSWKK